MELSFSGRISCSKSKKLSIEGEPFFGFGWDRLKDALREFLLFAKSYPAQISDFRLAFYFTFTYKYKALDIRFTIPFFGVSPLSKFPPSSRPDFFWLRSFSEICLQVANLHELGASHLDIKSKNIVIDAGLHLHLVDFGAALFEEEFLAYSGREKTSLWNRPPESFKDKQYHSFSTDVYSIGATILILLGWRSEVVVDAFGRLESSEAKKMAEQHLKLFLDHHFDENPGFAPVKALLALMLKLDSLERLNPRLLLQAGQYLGELSESVSRRESLRLVEPPTFLHAFWRRDRAPSYPEEDAPLVLRENRETSRGCC